MHMLLHRSEVFIVHSSLVAVSYQQLQLTQRPSSASRDAAPYLCLAVTHLNVIHTDEKK